ncbi:MAG: sigma-54 dependent transcriptional regulator [Deltaproteobacteria bacterium]|nr:sigma-54 dependent transcriptional regulator [Deltaproteobacteria bacterium]
MRHDSGERLARQAKPAILIAERDDTVRRSLKELLLRCEFSVIDCSEKNAILQTILNSSIDLIILGSLGESDWAGLELAQQIRRFDTKVPIILIAAQTSEELAIAALKGGVNDYFKRPFSLEGLVSSVNRCLPDILSQRPQKRARDATSAIIDGHRLVGASRATREIAAAIGRIASTDSNVLITGETGTGKDLVAELIHKNSPRASQPFVCINCAAIPDSLLESELFGYERGSFTGAYSASKGKLKFGDGGTIFLDEIGDMSPIAQAKILRVIESREVQRLGGTGNTSVNVRFIAATNKDLEQSVSEKTFRKDLYYRLNVTNIHIPQLRDRKEDIPALCNHYIGLFNRRFGGQVEGFGEDTAQSLFRYDWPGNVRELKNLLEATVGNLRHRQIAFVDLPEHFRRRLRGTKPLPLDERYPLLSVLNSTNWNISKAAQKLHWSRMTIYRKMAKYDIRRTESANIESEHRGLDRIKEV